MRKLIGQVAGHEIWADLSEELPDPTLTDFQKLRLETAMKFFIAGGDSTWLNDALHDADTMINLVLTTPFKAND